MRISSSPASENSRLRSATQAPSAAPAPDIRKIRRFTTAIVGGAARAR
jgi:hypothetical protein